MFDALQLGLKLFDAMGEFAFLSLGLFHVAAYEECGNFAVMSEKNTSPKKINTPPITRPAVLFGTTSP